MSSRSSYNWLDLDCAQRWENNQKEPLNHKNHDNIFTRNIHKSTFTETETSKSTFPGTTAARCTMLSARIERAKTNTNTNTNINNKNKDKYKYKNKYKNKCKCTMPSARIGRAKTLSLSIDVDKCCFAQISK